MTVGEVWQVCGALGALLGAGNILWTWHNQSQLPGKTAVKDLECDVEDHDRRIQALESEIRHMPTKDDLGRVELGLERMLGQLAVVQVEVAGSVRSMRRIEDHLRGEKA